jgi:hypothetical protein
MADYDDIRGWGRNSRRRFLAIATATTGGFALAACGAGAEGDAEADVPVADEPDEGLLYGAAAVATDAKRYSTEFLRTEYPISEGGVWRSRGRYWTRVRTAYGMAYGTNGARNTYDDSYAYLSGFAANQQAEAVIYRSTNLNYTTHEAELLLRWSDTTDIARGYECQFNQAGGVQVVRWNGPFGDFTPLRGSQGSIGRKLRTGDVVRARIVGSTITCYVNNVQESRITDQTWSSGQPGIGFFKRLSGSNTNLAFLKFTATTV